MDVRDEVLQADRSAGLAVVSADDARDVNRRYMVSYVTSLPNASDLRVLDFGCGGGGLVRMLRGSGVDCYGADVFYDGANYDGDVFDQLTGANLLRTIGEDGVLPFETDFFDVVVSDQVFEHVGDLEGALDELDRVLKPDGHMYHHFPSREVWREGHIHIAFAHRFRPTRARRAYTLLLRSLGRGKHKDELSIRAWTDRALSFLDDFCHYRRYPELRQAFEARYEIEHREIDYCRYRAGNRSVLGRVLAVSALTEVFQWIFRRVAFMAIRLTPRAD